FSSIEKNSVFSEHEKERQKRKLVKEEKQKIKNLLLKLHAAQDDLSQLNEEEVSVYEKFRYVTEKNKFKVASERGRLRMQLGQKNRFEKGIVYSGRYLRQMEQIFKEE